MNETSSTKILVTDSYKDRIDLEEIRIRTDVLNLAVKAHDAGDKRKDVLDKATAYLAFLRGEK